MGACPLLCRNPFSAFDPAWWLDGKLASLKSPLAAAYIREDGDERFRAGHGVLRCASDVARIRGKGGEMVRVDFL